MNCSNCSFSFYSDDNICPDCGFNNKNANNDEFGLGELLAIAGAGFLFLMAFKFFIRKINWEKLGDFLIELTNNIAQNTEPEQLHPRLDQAETMVSSGENYSSEMAGSLACGTLESGLRYLNGPAGWDQVDEPRGLYDLANNLYTKGKITHQEASKIKSISAEIRNPIAHGALLENPDKVQEAIYWIRNFINSKINYG